MVALEAFGRECFFLKGPEECFQAWLAVYMCQAFGVNRVYREADFGLRESYGSGAVGVRGVLPSRSVFERVLEGTAKTISRKFFTDLAISWGENADARNQACRPLAIKSVLPYLQQWAIITELKVTMSQNGGLSSKEVVRDVKKLGIFADLHRVSKESGFDKPLLNVFLLLDNHPEGSFFTPNKLSRVLNELSLEWPSDVDRPEIVTIRADKDRIVFDVYEEFLLTQSY